jgi:putative ABC transport system permease protein
MKLRLMAGRDFSQNLATDVDQSVIVNQELARELSWVEPLGQTVTLDSLRFTVIGVVEDFHNDGVWNPIQPAIFGLAKPEEFRYLTVRVRAENLAAMNEFLRREWQSVAPDMPYEGFYQDEVMAEAISVSENIKTMFIYISVLAIVISMMGLFALVSLNIARRTKEIGIRKVLGASVAGVAGLISKEFAQLVLLANVVAWPAAYYTMSKWLQNYAYRIELGAGVFFLATALALGIALLTISFQAVKAALANPVEALRYE